MVGKQNVWERVFRVLASVRTGIILLIIVGVVAAAGTIILQRPLTEAADMQRAYSPQSLALLDRVGLTDVYHSWWFALLMALLGVTILCASIDRFPKAWRLLSRPYRRPEPHFRAVTPIHKQIPVPSASAGLMAAERAFRRAGLHPERVVEKDEVSLFAERNRFAVLSVYIVHVSLLLILVGGIVDAFFGYKGYMMLTKGQQTSKLDLSNGAVHPLPFTLRCDGAGQENYPDGSPKKWWSDLVVLENGREVIKKQIVVNDPLVTHGIRFYQASYGATGDVDTLTVAAMKTDATGARDVALRPNQPAQLDADTSVTLLDFRPDAIMSGGQVVSRSRNLDNPALLLQVDSRSTSKAATFWYFPAQQRAGSAPDSPYAFQVRDIQMAVFTGLQVSHEPGQWAVWAGCLLMGVGLISAFYCVHQRYWAVVLEDAKQGLVLWIGTAADKNREHFQERFAELSDDVAREVAAEGVTRAAAAASLVTVS
jgi:cytochrome c biogenesis protein